MKEGVSEFNQGLVCPHYYFEINKYSCSYISEYVNK